jgi:hypothetical protein
MKLRILLPALIFLPLAILRAAAPASPTDAVMKELSWRDAHPLADYSYVVNDYGSDIKRVYRVNHIGVFQTRNLLLSVNNRPSNELEIRKFTLERNNYSDDPASPQKPGDINRWIRVGKPAAMIAPGTLKLKQAIGDQQYYTFTAHTSVGGSEPVDLDGTLVYDSKEGFVTMIVLTSAKPFKAGEHGKVENFQMRMNFDKNDKMRAVVPTGISWTVSGRKSMLSGYQDKYQATYDDYKIESGK